VGHFFACVASFAMNGDDAGRERKSRPGENPDDDLSARLRRLDAQLDRKRETAPTRDGGLEQQTSGAAGIGRAFRMSTEFVAGILAGGGLGWLFDRLLGTSPWGLIVLLMLGFAAGIMNVVRAASAAGKPPQASGSSADPRV
jgi:ATP synthase protein I